MPIIKFLNGRIGFCDIVLFNNISISLPYQAIDATGKGSDKRKYVYQGQQLFYIDYHIFPDGKISFIVSDIPIFENWWQQE